MIVLFLTTICTFVPSCKKKAQSSAQAVATDSLVKRELNELYTNPAKAEKVYIAAQRGITDSACFYQLELFRGIARMMQGDNASLVKVHARVADYCHRHPEAQMLAGIYYNHHAVILQNQGKRDSAIYYFKKTYAIMMQLQDGARAVDVCINLADINRQGGDMARSASYYRRALFIADSADAHYADFSILTGLANVYSELGDYTEAAKYYGQARHFAATAAPYDAFFFYNSWGNSFYYQQRYPQAIQTFRLARSAAFRVSQPDAIAIVYANLGEVFMLNGNLDSARIYLNHATQAFSKIRPLDYGSRFYLNSLLGDLASHEHRYSEALKYFSMKVDTPLVTPRYLMLHFQRLERFYSAQRDYPRAYRYLRLAKRFDDSLSSRRYSNQMAELEYRYRQDTTLLHSNIKIQQKDTEVSRLRSWIYGITLLVVAVSIIVVLMMRNRRKKAQLAQMNLRESLFSLRMQNARNRIAPHFVFNVLNRSLSTENEGVRLLVDLLRKNLELCDRYIVPLADEIDFIATYIANERPALGDNFVYDCEVAPDVDIHKVCIPSMMVQIFVENAVKHGLRGYSGDKYLRLSFSHERDFLLITVRNNGLAAGSLRPAESTGTGLKVVTRTIQMLNERNRNKISLNFGADADADGSHAWNVEIRIPVDFDFSTIGTH